MDIKNERHVLVVFPILMMKHSVYQVQWLPILKMELLLLMRA